MLQYNADHPNDYLKKQKKEFWFVLARTFGLAVLSFVIGIILKIIFKK